jgi:penicillin-binding protein 1A
MARILKALALLVITAVVVPVVTAGTVLASFLFLPLPAALPEPRHEVDAQVSKVYDINGNQIGVFRRFEITQPVTWEDITANPYLTNAVLAGEDRRFYQHGGIDVRGTLRAMWADIRNRETVQGGSTITQQYVKNAYVGKERSLSRKIREAILASQLDRQKSKDEILFLYLDQVYLGEGAYGVGAAAQTYFRKSVRDLTLSEAATLAGLIPAPSYYDPRTNPAGAELKRTLILKKMLDDGFIDQAAYDAALPERIVFVPTGAPPPPPATVVWPREAERLDHPYFMDYLRRYLEWKYGPDAVYTRGFQIYTTMDPKLQDAAEQEVAKTLDGAPPEVSMALVSVEPGSGYVKALVGGRDFYGPDGNNNLALAGPELQAGKGKQPGSSIKPFILAEALDQGMSPNRTYSGRNGICVGGGKEPYCPNNFGKTNYGTMNLREALKHSVNTIFVQLLQDIGVEPTMDLAKRLGLSTYDYDPKRDFLSVGLGSHETDPLDMASAYGVWAARGTRADPTPIVRLLDSDDRTVEDNTEPKTRRVLKEEVADTINSILQGPLQPGGTAAGKGLGEHPAAGKTGTAQDFGNAWFVGYTPQLSTAVWMGHVKDQRNMGPVKGVRSVVGGTWPARTWQAFMKRALEKAEIVQFNEPAPITEILDDAKRRARKGFDIGAKRNPIPEDDGGNLEPETPPPSVDPPTSTTTTTTTEIDFNPGRSNGGGNGNGGL